MNDNGQMAPHANSSKYNKKIIWPQKPLYAKFHLNALIFLKGIKKSKQNLNFIFISIKV